MTTEQSSKVAVGFLIGVGVGAAVGLLMAPQSARSRRSGSREGEDSVDSLRTAGQRVKETVQDVSAQGRTQVAEAVEAGL